MTEFNNRITMTLAEMNFALRTVYPAEIDFPGDDSLRHLVIDVFLKDQTRRDGLRCDACLTLLGCAAITSPPAPPGRQTVRQHVRG